MDDEERAAKLLQLVEQARVPGESFDDALDYLLANPVARYVADAAPGSRWWRQGHPLPP